MVSVSRQTHRTARICSIKGILREDELRRKPTIVTFRDFLDRRRISVIRQALLDPGPELVVCDEGHKIKNLNTGISIALGSIKTTWDFVFITFNCLNILGEGSC